MTTTKPLYQQRKANLKLNIEECDLLRNALKDLHSGLFKFEKEYKTCDVLINKLRRAKLNSFKK
jgi:hypothetical protein